MDHIRQRFEDLKTRLTDMGAAAVAFSGGVDSTFLLQTAADVLGTENVLAVTAVSAFTPEAESAEARAFCLERGIRQEVLRLDVLDIEGIRRNPPDRCYICKKAIFENIIRTAAEHGISHVADGSNADDQGGYRPGLRALAELGILSPLKEAGLTKQDIRDLSKERGLATWNKPAMACLASRFVYGETLDEGRLKMAERSEGYLRSLGLKQFRVRVHGEGANTLARIEVLPADLEKIMKDGTRQEIAAALKKEGFAYVSLDLSGYRTGSMNETLEAAGEAGHRAGNICDTKE